jgi:hypothetical protein
MRNYLTTKAPWWLLVLITGGGFWILNVIGRALAPSWFPDMFLGGLISAVLFGLFAAALIAGPRRRRGRGSAPTDED